MSYVWVIFRFRAGVSWTNSIWNLQKISSQSIFNFQLVSLPFLQFSQFYFSFTNSISVFRVLDQCPFSDKNTENISILKCVKLYRLKYQFKRWQKLWKTERLLNIFLPNLHEISHLLYHFEIVMERMQVIIKFLFQEWMFRMGNFGPSVFGGRFVRHDFDAPYRRRGSHADR